MRNLRNIQRLVLDQEAFLNPTACTWDSSTGGIICAFGPTKDNTLIELKRWHPMSEDTPSGPSVDVIASWDAPCPLPTLECDKIVNLQYFSDTATSCLTLAGGDIIVVRDSTLLDPGATKIEIVGSVDVGISAASWSPDEELLAICTNGDTLLYMTRDFENVTSAALSSEDLHASKHVSVGWGKSETQFKGKGQKALRDPTMPEEVDQGLVSPGEDRGTVISWRGDGAYVAVNSIQASTRRVIRIYSREGLLDGVTEPVDYLEGGLSWRPAGNLMAGIRRLSDRIDVVFFERNGLRHGQFSLRLNKEEMDDWGATISLEWNVDSSVLAVCFLDRVQLWTMGNYHYYLKHEVMLKPGEKRGRVFLKWHPEQPLLYAIGCSEGSLERLEYVSRIHKGSTLHPNDHGIVGVIDGEMLMMTPLRYTNIPPPMALYEVKVDSNIMDVAFWNSESSVTRIAILTKSKVFLYEWSLTARIQKEPDLLKSYTIEEFTTIHTDSGTKLNFLQIEYIAAHKLVLLASDGVGTYAHIFALEAYNLSSKVCHQVLPDVQQIFLDVNQQPAVPYLCIRGSELAVDQGLLETTREEKARQREKVLFVSGGHINHAEILTLDESSLQMSSGLENGARADKVVVSLLRNGSLYANGKCLATNCTSFLTTRAHIIFTTSQHLLKFVHLVNTESLEVPPDTPEADERCRTIERGARLVTVIPSTSAVVLQMPRGNLETIYPRALVLAGIRTSINDKKYKAAFMACRSHRVDMNIIYDYEPESFLANICLFIDQVRKVEHLDLFLSQLRNEDVSLTIYKETLMKAHLKVEHTPAVIPVTAQHDNRGSSKVNTICDAFLVALKDYMKTNLQNVITSHVCKVPPDLESGLKEVARLQMGNLEHAERAVEHICFLVDVNKLYDTALGLYDIKLTLLVAQRSQKDPREYIPFLQHMQNLPLLRMKIEIDNHLGRYEKCLKHFQDLDAFEESKNFMSKHSLYKESLQLYRYQEEKVKDIMKLYADYVFDKSQFKEAAISYEYLQDFKSASESYRKAYLWQESLSCASLIPIPEDQIRSIAFDIADSLLELKEYHAAATIKLDYLHDYESAARIFCKGYFFADAIRVLSLRGLGDAIESIVDAGLIEAMGTVTELLAECKEQLNAQVPRLRELRIKKAEEPLAFYDADANGGADIPDNISLAATDASTVGASLFTRYTNQTGTVGTSATRKTSKNKRREERKRAKGKKGSVYEEEYLVNSVGRLIDRVNAINDEVSRLVFGLMRRRMRERARAVVGAMVSVVELCTKCLPEVFLKPSKHGMEGAKVIDGETQHGQPNGADGVLWDSSEELHAAREPPVVKTFEGWSILAS